MRNRRRGDARARFETGAYISVKAADRRNEADSRSRNSVTFGWRCRIDAGTIGEIGPSSVALHGRRLARVRHDDQQFARAQHLGNRHRHRRRGYVVEAGKPSFADLLASARGVEMDDGVGQGRVGNRRADR